VRVDRGLGGRRVLDGDGDVAGEGCFDSFGQQCSADFGHSFKTRARVFKISAI